MTALVRRKALITGAAGGMGRACAQLFGATCDLVLSDVSAARLDAFARELRDGGHVVNAHAGDMLDPDHIAALAGELAGGVPCAVIHTAGLSPALADWQAIMKVNLTASEMLMQALEPVLAPGSVVVPIASMAGHMMPAIAELDALLVDPLGDGFIQGIGAAVEAMGGNGGDVGKRGVSYSLSKRGVHLLAERWGMALGPRGVRVVSISPGVIHTPMGLAENEKTPGARETMDAAVVGRIGSPMDIAMAARFLCSEEAGFITACDLKVDGGSIAAVMAPKPD
jgi:NAD(P)-dependent dehydrogenase (short-subunit alcohol dehydrogenase family)